MENEKRKLIKFSNYSLCVTLPKWVTNELNWRKGEIVRIKLDESKKQLLITKDGKISKGKVEEKKKETKLRW